MEGEEGAGRAREAGFPGLLTAALERVRGELDEEASHGVLVLLYALLHAPSPSRTPSHALDLLTAPVTSFLVFALGRAAQRGREGGLGAALTPLLPPAPLSSGGQDRVFSNRGRAGGAEESLADMAHRLLTAHAAAACPPPTSLPLPLPLAGRMPSHDLALYLLYRALAVAEACEGAEGEGAAHAEDSPALARALSSALEGTRAAARSACGGRGMDVVASIGVDAGRCLRDLAVEPLWTPPSPAMLSSLASTPGPGAALTAAALRAGLPARSALPLARLRLAAHALEDASFLSAENAGALAACTLPSTLLFPSAPPSSRLTLVACLLALTRAASSALARAGEGGPVRDAQTLLMRVLINVSNGHKPGCEAIAGASLRPIGAEGGAPPWGLPAPDSRRIAGDGGCWGVAVIVDVIAAHCFVGAAGSGSDGAGAGRRKGGPSFDSLVTALGLLANVVEGSTAAREGLGRVRVDLPRAGVRQADVLALAAVSVGEGAPCTGSSGVGLLAAVLADRARRMGLTGEGEGGAEADDVVVGAYTALTLGCVGAGPGNARSLVLRSLSACLSPPPPGAAWYTPAVDVVALSLRAYLALQAQAGLLSEETVASVGAVQGVLDAITAGGEGAAPTAAVEVQRPDAARAPSPPSPAPPSLPPLPVISPGRESVPSAGASQGGVPSPAASPRGGASISGRVSVSSSPGVVRAGQRSGPILAADFAKALASSRSGSSSSSVGGWASARKGYTAQPASAAAPAQPPPASAAASPTELPWDIEGEGAGAGAAARPPLGRTYSAAHKGSTSAAKRFSALDSDSD